MGSSLGGVLRTQADDLRNLRRERALAEAESLEVKLVFPLVICFLPGIFVAAAGPAFYQFVQLIDRIVREGARSLSKRLLHAAALAALLTLGCSHTMGPTPERQDLAPCLARLLEQWEALKASGQTCEDLPRAGQPERDCGRIQLGLPKLVAEFPNEPSALMANAVVSYEVGYPTRAQAYLDAVRALQPGHPEAAGRLRGSGPSLSPRPSTPRSGESRARREAPPGCGAPDCRSR